MIVNGIARDSLLVLMFAYYKQFLLAKLLGSKFTNDYKMVMGCCIIIIIINCWNEQKLIKAFSIFLSEKYPLGPVQNSS